MTDKQIDLDLVHDQLMDQTDKHFSDFPGDPQPVKTLEAMAALSIAQDIRLMREMIREDIDRESRQTYQGPPVDLGADLGGAQ